MVVGFGQRIYTGADADRKLGGTSLIRYKDGNTAPAFIQLSQPKDADALNGWLRKALSMTAQDQLLPVRTETDALGFTHAEYQQYHQGVPVEYAKYRFHSRNGMVESMNGEYYPDATVSVSPAITSQQAIQSAMDETGASVYKWELVQEEEELKYLTGSQGSTYYPQPRLVIVAENGDYSNRNFRLAWKMDIYAHAPMSRQWVYVDAQTGKVILKTNRIHTVDAPGTAQTAFSGSRGIVADFTGSTYRLREAGRGNGIETYNMNTGTSYGASVDFTDADNNWNNVNAQLDQYAADAHWGSEMTYDFYWTIFSRNSIDGNGFKLRNYVHYDNAYDNAFWDGNRMTYGDGGSSFDTPLTSIDIAGHEITHGLTEFTASLVYQNESGALNESFSDIFGVSIDNWARNTTGANLWLIGEETTSGSGIRSMSNPNSFGDPDTYTGTNWYTGAADNGGVHINSGVQNHWFYRLVQGGSGTNDLGNAYNVTAQGIAKARAIAFRNLTVYLTANSDYSDARFYAIQSAIDLYGPCSNEVIATTNAWHAVGVGGPFVVGVDAAFMTPTTSFCQAPAQVTFTNNSTNAGSYLWYFGDGNTSTAINPTHIYTNYGTYTVKLVAYGGSCGNDSVTQTAYITVDSNLPCAVTLASDGTNQLQTSCTGTIYDSGGPSGNYQDNTNSIITIAPTGAATITLNFTQFDFEAGYDYLYVYDGPNITSPLIGQYDGTTLPNGGSITSTGGAITLRQSTDPGVTEPGFTVNWTCNLPTTPPAAEFYATSLTTCDGTINFVDQTTNGANSWLWNFGDGNTSTAQNPTHTYQNDGVYTVVLTVSNNIGNNSITKTNYITVDRPDAPVALSQGICTPASVILTATASGMVNWYNTPGGTVPFFSGTAYTTPVISTTTTYYVENAVASPTQHVGPLNNSFGTGGFHNNTSVQYMEFDVLQPLTINSVWVNSAAAGNRTVTLWDNSGNLIDTRFINIPSGQSRITLNFDVAPGTGYRIGGSEMNLYRNNAGATFPYQIGGLVKITGSSAGGGYYYYFYDWEVQGEDCVSPRIPVSVTVGNLLASFTAAPTGLQVAFTSGATTATSWSWNFGDGNASTQQNPTHTYSAFGSYTVTHIAGNGSCGDTTTQQIVLSENTGIGEPGNSILFSAYPNPFTDVVNVKVTLPAAGKLTADMQDILGRKLGNIYNGTIEPGEYTFQWQPGALPSGVYLLNLQIDGKLYQHKLVHVK